ncbi:MAG: hypothetical protein KGH87_02005 [Thaumarchaeota archaeon]|nr:hypothetical protein [Candidatus Nitrosotalea sp.]MDE1813222.1 hypothetical protein [Nitrososphaerota archaeon]MDE1838671.1 hypothetical protein [Nitrososphaerota archaeon]
MKTLHLLIIIGVTIVGFIATVVIMPNQNNEKVILNANGGKPLDLTFHVKELDVRTYAIVTPSLSIKNAIVTETLTFVNPAFPIVLERGKNATLKIEIESHVPYPLSLQLRVFNNVDNNYDLAFAHVKFNGDASGLPNGLTASFNNDVTTVDANGSDQETLTFNVGQNVQAGNYQIGVLGLATINSPAGTEMGNSHTLWIPITIK